MKKFTYLDLAALVVWLLPIGYLAYIYPDLPIRVPMHYGLNGTVDRYGSKQEFLVFQGIMLFVGVLIFLLFKYLPLIDPKKQVKVGEGTFQKLGLGVIMFMSALNIAIMVATSHHGFRVDKIVFPLVGLLFAFMGNMMHSIKPNYFAGIRTPWTLENEDNWRVTHRLAGKLWFIGGIGLTIVTLVLPSSVAFIIFLLGTFTVAIIPVIFSYLYFKKHQLNHNS